MRIQALLLLLLLFGNGCMGGSTSFYQGFAPKKTTKEYQIGQPQSITVGGQIMGLAYDVGPVCEAIRDFQPQHGGGHMFPPLKKGMIFFSSPIPGDTSNGRLRMILSDEYTSRSRDGGEISVVLFVNNAGVVQQGMNGMTWTNDTLFRIIEPATQKIALKFTGKEKNVITMTYRDYIQEAGSVENEEVVRHDLAVGDTYKFMGVNIKFIQATESRLDFIVISDNDTPGSE
jgi:hypothetical protein